jgi:hypothetical protein
MTQIRKVRSFPRSIEYFEPHPEQANEYIAGRIEARFRSIGDAELGALQSEGLANRILLDRVLESAVTDVPDVANPTPEQMLEEVKDSLPKSNAAVRDFFAALNHTVTEKNSKPSRSR